MSRIWQDGFDIYAVAADLNFRYNVSGSGISVNTTGGRFGGGLVLLATNSSYIQCPLLSSPVEIWNGVSFFSDEPTVADGNNVVCQFISAAGCECTLTYNPLTLVFNLIQSDGSGASLGISEPIILAYQVWHFLDVHFKLETSTTGVLEVWIDNIRVMNLTGIRTAWKSGTVLTALSFGKTTGPLSSQPLGLDDWCVNDPNTGTHNTGRIGDSRIISSTVTSDASPNDGTPSSGSSHFAMVNEAQWSSATKLTLTNTTGQEENFTISALPITPLLIFAVQVVSISEKSDSGTALAQLGITSAATTVEVTDLTVPVSWGINVGVFEVDPNGNIAWVKASVDALDVNYKVQ